MLRALFSRLAFWREPGRADIILVQDDTSLHSDCRAVQKDLRRYNYDLSIVCLLDSKALFSYLDQLEDKTKIPDVFFLDVLDSGAATGLKLVHWFRKNCPERPLPEINFASKNLLMSQDASAQLMLLEPDVVSHPTACDEFKWYRHSPFFEQPSIDLVTCTFRKTLNRLLDCNISLAHRSENNPKNPDISRVIFQDDIISGGFYPPARALEKLQNLAFEIMDRRSCNKAEFLQQNASSILSSSGNGVFYEQSSASYIGPAIFHLQDIDTLAETDIKPVLIMQSYDPAMVPLLSSGKIGGLVTASPYMASHLKMLCDANRISGLFGLIQEEGMGIAGAFNEFAKPDTSPYFSRDKAELGPFTIVKGQMVVTGVQKNVLSLGSTDLSCEMIQSANNDSEARLVLEKDLFFARNMNELAKKYCAEFAHRFPTIKVNVDSLKNPLVPYASGIGLVRTEQMVAQNSRQAGLAKAFLLKDDKEALVTLSPLLQRDYVNFSLARDTVRLRLFDFSPRELLNREEQKEFKRKYGTLDIRGGDALKAWPDLYKEQIYAALNGARGNNQSPLEIMMPAVKTKEDVLAVKSLVEESAGKFRYKAGSQYRFGVMAETLNCCENIESIAPQCHFISFGTNDLTEDYFGISRGDLPERKRFRMAHGYDPFKMLAPPVLDVMRDVIARARSVNPGIEIDVCGAQAAEPDTALALIDAGIDNISVAPTKENLCILPLVLAYRMYDRLSVVPANTNAPPRPAGFTCS